MSTIPVDAVHHITLNGADKQTSMEFWGGVMGMVFVAEQPNLDNPGENHLYFDPGDDRMITIFTDEARTPDSARVPTDQGSVHHIAFNVRQDQLSQTQSALKARGISYVGPKDRGFMDSIYFRDPLGLLIEIAAYTFEPPAGHTYGSVMAKAFALRQADGAAAIERKHVFEAVEMLTK